MRIMCRNDLALAVGLVVLGLGALVLGIPLFIQYFPEMRAEAIWAGVTALFTIVLAWSSIKLWGETKAIGDRTDRAFRTAERAYVKMSHHPPGLHIEAASGLCWLSLQVKNFGRTPARVTHAFLTVKLLPNNESLASKPLYKTNLIDQVYKAFLVTDDHATYYPMPFGIGAENVPGLQDGTLKLYLIGHVDYVDMFNRRYQAGYARVYYPEVDKREEYGKGEVGDEAFANRSNLVFLTEGDYNYDICLDEDV
jgi:hypothetical protein